MENVPKEEDGAPSPTPKDPAPAPAPVPAPDVPDQQTPPAIPPSPKPDPQIEGYSRQIGQTQLTGLNKGAASVFDMDKEQQHGLIHNPGNYDV